MNPEELKRLLELAEKAAAAGRDTADINLAIARRSGGQFSTMENLAKAAAGPDTTAKARKKQTKGEAPTGQTAGDVLRLLGQGVTLGGFDEAAGGVAALGALVPGGKSPGEAFQETQQRVEADTRESRERLGGGLATATEVAGGLLPIARGIGAAKSAGGLLARGAKAAKSAVTNPRAAATAAKEAGRAAPKVLPSVARGAAEGAALGAGVGGAEGLLRTEGTFDERVEGMLRGGRFGGLLGAPVGAAARGASAVRDVIRAPREGGEALAKSARKQGQVSGRASNVEQDISLRKQGARDEFIRPLEAQGRDIPIDVTETVLGDPVLRQHAEAVAPKVIETAKMAAAGKTGSSLPLSAEEALSLRRSVSQQASAFRSAAGGSLGAGVNPIDVKQAERALSKLDDVMNETLEGFPQFQAAWAQQKARGRALLAGRKTFNSSADDVEALWQGRPPAQKSLKSDFPQGLPDDPQVRQAFREGLATELVKKLEGGESGVGSFISNMQTSSQLQDKMRIVLGGNEQLARFMAAVDAESNIRRKADLAKTLIKAAGFLGAGTSLFGGALADLF